MLAVSGEIFIERLFRACAPYARPPKRSSETIGVVCRLSVPASAIWDYQGKKSRENIRTRLTLIAPALTARTIQLR
jgi:hypothetical protein